jgi:O-antigen/teichoic acid export membrane protein
MSFSDMIQTYAQGTLVLILGQMVSTLISAIGTIIIARILGPSSFGILSIALIPISIALMFIANGVTRAIITFTVEQRHLGENQDTRTIILAGLRINLTIASIVTIVTYLTSGIIANNVFQRPELEQLIKILSVSVVAQAAINLSAAVFIGFEKMGMRALINISRSILNTIIGPTLVFLGFGVIGAAYGNSLPIIVSGIIGLLAVFLRMRTLPTSSTSLSDCTKKIILYSYPLFFSNFLAGSLRQLFSFILPFYVSASIIGNYTAAVSFTVLINFFLTPLNTTTLPLLSKLKPEDPMLKFVFQSLIKYKTLVALPISAAIIALSDHLALIFYGETYNATPLFLRLFMINYFLIGLGSQTIGMLLNSQKETKINFRRTIINLTLGLPLGIFLIPRYGVVGLILTQMITPMVGLIYSLWWIRTHYTFSVDFQTIFKTFISASVGFICCLTLISLISINPWVEVFMGGSILMITYLTSILLTGALTKKNLQDIHSLLKKYEILNPLINPIFKILANLSRY